MLDGSFHSGFNLEIWITRGEAFRQGMTRGACGGTCFPVRSDVARSILSQNNLLRLYVLERSGEQKAFIDLMEQLGETRLNLLTCVLC